jgi:F0F1-type ATP synthase delta subunit
MKKKPTAKKPVKVDHWQKQANHFQKILDDMSAVVADPATTPEDLAEAQQTIIDMTANLARLVDKHAVRLSAKHAPAV